MFQDIAEGRPLEKANKQTYEYEYNPEASIATMNTKSTHTAKTPAPHQQAKTPLRNRAPKQSQSSGGRLHSLNKTTVLSGGLDVRKGSEARGGLGTDGSSIPDVMNQQNVGNVISMLRKAESQLDREYEKSDFMQAFRRK